MRRLGSATASVLKEEKEVSLQGAADVQPDILKVTTVAANVRTSDYGQPDHPSKTNCHSVSG
jgi:hypothetical protein